MINYKMLSGNLTTIYILLAKISIIFILIDYTQFLIYFTFFKGLKTMGILYGGKN